jgi:diacylglycerol kinase family enzyme
LATAHWIVIINRQTCGSGWKKWDSFLQEHAIDHSLHHTYSIPEAEKTLTEAYQKGHRNYLFVGGDGTVHHGTNILMHLAGQRSMEVTMGVLPCGTGNDWVRTYGSSPEKLARSLKEGDTAPVNLIKVTWPDGRVRYAANMVGAALDAAVVDTLKGASLKMPSYILYPYGLMRTLLKPHKWSGNIRIDDEHFSGDFLTLQAGFAKYCGGGMYVLPHARQDSPGLLIMKPKSLLKLMVQFPTIYTGDVVKHKEAVVRHFEEIEIAHHGKPIPIEADGEWLGYSPVKLTACFDVMRRVV